ncbi:MAG: diguanylate cyclase, partial [Thermodesulfobacteriota bacterium]
DYCLKKVARALSACARRPGDSVARYGGEEFAAVLSGISLTGALELAELMRLAVEDLRLPHGASETSPVVTVSLGVASLIPSREATEETLLLAADEALYRAKAGGRNRVAAAGDQ